MVIPLTFIFLMCFLNYSFSLGLLILEKLYLENFWNFGVEWNPFRWNTLHLECRVCTRISSSLVAFFVEWCTVEGATFVLLSKWWHTELSVFRAFPVRTIVFEVMLPPAVARWALNSLFWCSISKSQGILQPGLPRVFTNQFHFTWCANLGGKSVCT